MDRVDCIVIGAGVIGLACGRALAARGLEVVVVERERVIGSGVSSRNSEVIHAGLHHAAGSLKADLCVRGRALLLAYCEARGIGHRRCGKLIVATRAQDAQRLEAIRAHGQANGVQGLELLTGAQARALEPELAAAAALRSPATGIVDSHALMLALLGDAQADGAMLAVCSGFASAEPSGSGWEVRTRGAEAGSDFALGARWLVNAAGLHAQAVASAMVGFPGTAIPPLHRARGNYFGLAGRAPFARLIYPLPVDGGLGVHLTLDLAGQARFGPDVQWLPAQDGLHDLDVDASRAVAFEAEVRRYWPGLPVGSLTPAYAGIRPKLSGPGEPAVDFRIDGPAQHGCAGVVQLFGIESPGLTASLAIGERVAAMVCDE